MEIAEGGRVEPRKIFGADELGRGRAGKEPGISNLSPLCGLVSIVDCSESSMDSCSSDIPPPPFTRQTRATRSAHSRVLTSRSAPLFSA